MDAIQYDVDTIHVRMSPDEGLELYWAVLSHTEDRTEEQVRVVIDFLAALWRLYAA